jgi:MFS family permease
MLYPALISLGALLAGPLADLLGVRHASLALAAAAALAIAALFAVSPQLRTPRPK